MTQTVFVDVMFTVQYGVTVPNRMVVNDLRIQTLLCMGDQIEGTVTGSESEEPA